MIIIINLTFKTYDIHNCVALSSAAVDSLAGCNPLGKGVTVRARGVWGRLLHFGWRNTMRQVSGDETGTEGEAVADNEASWDQRAAGRFAF